MTTPEEQARRSSFGWRISVVGGIAMAAVAVIQLAEKPKLGLAAVAFVVFVAAVSNPAIWRRLHRDTPPEARQAQSRGDRTKTKARVRRAAVLAVVFVVVASIASPPNPRPEGHKGQLALRGGTPNAGAFSDEAPDTTEIPPRARSRETTVGGARWANQTALGGTIVSAERACVNDRQVVLTRGDASPATSPSTKTDHKGNWSIQGLSETGSFNILVRPKVNITRSGQAVYCTVISSHLIAAQRPDISVEPPPPTAPLVAAVSPQAGATSPGSVEMTLANRPPVGRPDEFRTTGCRPIHGNVLMNDYDPDGDRILAVYPTRHESRVVWGGSDGSFTYTPPPKACVEGDNRILIATGFQYKVQDAHGRRTKYIDVSLHVDQ